MTDNTCATCGNSLPPPADTGRPRRYCGEGCKRAAGYEITRINRLLEKLETRLSNSRIFVEQYGTPGRDIPAIENEIALVRSRLLLLLAE